MTESEIKIVGVRVTVENSAGDKRDINMDFSLFVAHFSAAFAASGGWSDTKCGRHIQDGADPKNYE